jgi:hypothetical protein
MIVEKTKYIALAQVNWKNHTEAFLIEQGPMDFELLAITLLHHHEDAINVQMYDNKLNMQGIWNRKAI